jgi:SAM-dependent methyltransferase
MNHLSGIDLSKTSMSNLESNLLFLEESGLLNKKADILEIGSGRGFLTFYLGKQGYKITGSEVEDEYLDFAKKNFSIELKKIFEDILDFPDNSFNMVLSFDVFEHIKNSDKHLSEVRRILRPGGAYLLQTPNKWTNAPFEMWKNKDLTSYKKYHCSLHNYWEIKKRFKKNNFDIKFIDIPVVNNFFIGKIEKQFGKAGLFLLKIINLNKLPLPLRTNFYIIAKPRD